MKRLIQIDGDKILRQIPLKKSIYSMGRGSNNDIVFDTGKVSRHHADLMMEGNRYVVCDKDSANHVFVNGEQIKKRRLESGDIINLSRDVTLLYISASDADEKISRMLNRMWEAINKKDFLRLKEVTNRIISLEGLERILNVILEEVIQLVGAERGFITLVDDTGKILIDKGVSYNLPVSSDSEVSAVFSHSIVRKVIETKKELFIMNTENGEDHSSSILELDLRSIMCAPLLFSNKLVGILYVDAGYQLSDFSEIDQFFFTILADHAAIAIENGKLYDQVQSSNVELRKEVQEQEERYRQLVELSPDSIMVHSEGRIIFINARGVELLGAGSAEELLGTPIIDFIHPDYQDEVARRMKLEEEGKTFKFMEEKIVRLDGTVVDVEATAAPLKFQGTPAVQVIFRDISIKKRIENEMQKIQKLESLGVLAGGIAHDFNNILTAIIGNISLAKLELEEDARITEFLNGAERASFRAKDLSQQLLTFSKGGAPVKKISTIRETIRDSVEFALRGSNIKCEFDIIDNLWSVEVDESQIGRVLNNLAINAQQAMPEGGIIQVTAENIQADENGPIPVKPGKYVKVSINDHGIGIPQKNLSKIFDPYFTTKQRGSGLGLATCYSIIKKHDGYITVDSALGEGSTFYFLLPAFPEKKPVGDVEKDKIIKGTGKILVMDDEEIIRSVAGRMLNLIGYVAFFAKNGEEAIEKYMEEKEMGEPFDAIIMDLTIPGGMGGEECMAKLKEIDPNAKVIVSSGYSSDPILANYRDYGFRGFLPKPYKVRELNKVLDEVLLSKQMA